MWSTTSKAEPTFCCQVAGCVAKSSFNTIGRSRFRCVLFRVIACTACVRRRICICATLRRFCAPWQLDSHCQQVDGSAAQLAAAIGGGADLRVGTNFPHSEHIDTASGFGDLIGEVAGFPITYLVQGKDGPWVAGAMTQRQPIECPIGPHAAITPVIWASHCAHCIGMHGSQASGRVPRCLSFYIIKTDTRQLHVPSSTATCRPLGVDALAQTTTTVTMRSQLPHRRRKGKRNRCVSIRSLLSTASLLLSRCARSHQSRGSTALAALYAQGVLEDPGGGSFDAVAVGRAEYLEAWDSESVSPSQNFMCAII